MMKSGSMSFSVRGSSIRVSRHSAALSPFSKRAHSDLKFTRLTFLTTLKTALRLLESVQWVPFDTYFITLFARWINKPFYCVTMRKIQAKRVHPFLVQY